MADEIGVIERVMDGNGRRAFRLFYLYVVDIKDANDVRIAVTPPASIDEDVVQNLLTSGEVQSLTDGLLAYEEPEVIRRKKNRDGPLETTDELFDRVKLDYAKRKAEFITENTDRFRRRGLRMSV